MFNFNIPAPKNAAEANRQAIRNERAIGIIRAGYTFSFDADLEVVYVCKPGSLEADYLIHMNAANSLDGRAGCTCPDAQTGICKHYIAASIVADMAKEEEANDTAQVAAYEAMAASCELESTGCDPYARY